MTQLREHRKPFLHQF